eukprot:5066472-Alexandrium_andersonii.AAC.1
MGRHQSTPTLTSYPLTARSRRTAAARRSSYLPAAFLPSTWRACVWLAAEGRAATLRPLAGPACSPEE